MHNEFILIGGGSLILHGSHRVTSDLDILVPEETRITLSKIGDVHIDKLTMAVQCVVFNTLKRFSLIKNGIWIPSLALSLGLKIRCWYLRNEDTQGERKKLTDMFDIRFLAGRMRDEGKVVSTEEAAAVPVNCYNMLLVVTELHDLNSLETFDHIGGRNFEVDWAENTEAQIENYLLFSEIMDTEVNLLSQKYGSRD